VCAIPRSTPFEGEGDALFEVDGSCLWAGHGIRTRKSSHQRLSETWKVEVISLRLVDPRFYHLDTCFCCLFGGYVMYVPQAFDTESLARIEQQISDELREQLQAIGFRVVEVSSSWVAGPDFPDDLDIADGPAALEVNGNVLMMTSPGVFQTGSVFLEWTGAPPLNQVPGPPNASLDSSYYGHMLMLPTGQILFTDFSDDVELFTSAGSQYTGWTPTLLITNFTMHANTTHKFSGFKFNGATQDNAYGDDFQDATNYPLMRFTSTSNGSVYYARTHDHSTMAVGYVGPTYTQVDIPNIPQGGYNLQVVVNGIASQNYLVGILNP
jgi:hypothetical protein